jgi:hypothetical protein
MGVFNLAPLLNTHRWMEGKGTSVASKKKYDSIGIIFHSRVCMKYSLGGFHMHVQELSAAAGPTRCATSPVLPPVNHLVIGKVDLNIIKDQTTKHTIIEANMHLFYIATANAKKPLVFHIHLNSATGPVAYTGSVSTDALGWILAQHVKMTATTHAPSDLQTFPTHGTWILNFHDTTLPHQADTPPVAVGHAPINAIDHSGKSALVTGFWQ